MSYLEGFDKYNDQKKPLNFPRAEKIRKSNQKKQKFFFLIPPLYLFFNFLEIAIEKLNFFSKNVD